MTVRGKQLGTVAALACCLAVGMVVAVRATRSRPDVASRPASHVPFTPTSAPAPSPPVEKPAPALRPPAGPQKPVITEFMAANKDTLKDAGGERPDWVEIHNPAAEAVNLEGWHLTDDRGAPAKWRFPAVTVPPRGYLLVYASGKDRRGDGGDLHANFKLKADGGYLALVEPDGRTIACEFTPAYPKQAEDVSFGLSQDVADAALVPEGTAARVLVPTDGKLGRDWTGVDFDDSAWTTGTTGVGYDTGSGYEKLIGTDVQPQMFGVNATVYVRVPFNVADDRPYQALSLRVRYDDGFIAYLNGRPVASRAAPEKADWNSRASSRRADDKATSIEEINLDPHAGLLRPGRNVLAVHGLNRPADSGDMLVLPELRAGRSLTARTGPGLYFPLPTPGAPNGAGAAALGPLVTDLRHTPPEPHDARDLVVTAAAAPFEHPVASVALHYRVMFGPEAHLTMHDDGAHGDGAAGDGIFGAAVPAGAAAAGKMVRYRVTATDLHGNESSAPRFADPLRTERYAGTVVAGSAVNTRLPVLQWFVENPDRAARSDGTRACVFFGGEFYDNVFVRKRGVSSSSWPKPNYKFDFPRGHHFRYAPGQPRVEEFNLQSTHSDKSYVRQLLAWETFRDAGAAHCVCFPLRVQQNGQFHSVAHFVEHPDRRYLKRLGLDPDGAMYKFVGNSGLRKATGFEKETRLHEGTGDIEGLVGALARDDGERVRYLFDNVDVPQVINYLAACVLTHDNDAILKNFFMYHDGRSGGGWKVLPWDKDLTFGRNHIPGEGVLNDTIWADHPVYSHPLAGDSDHPKNHYATAYNALTDAVHDHPATRQMFLRRLRTLMDQMLQPPGTDPALLRYERRLEELYELMGPDVTLDRAKWGNPFGADEDFPAALADLKLRYFAARRAHLYGTHGPENGGLVPAAQPADAALRFGAVEPAPDPTGATQEYVEVMNPNHFAVDASGWRLDGSVAYVLPPGTVVPALGSMYLCADPVAFRARTAGPRGGLGLFVQGGYTGRLRRMGVTLRLTDGAGRTVATFGGSGGEQ